MDVRQREYHLGYETVAAHQASLRWEAGAERASRGVKSARPAPERAGWRTPGALLASLRAAIAHLLARPVREEAGSGQEA